MRAYGAELILVTKEQGMEGARSGAEWRIAAKESCSISSIIPITHAHYTTTGPEIGSKLARITICLQHGNNRHYHRRVTLYARTIQTGDHCWPAAGKAAVFPAFAAGLGISAGDFNASLVDEVLDIHTRCGKHHARTGSAGRIFCGVSSGGAVAGALPVSKANPGAVVVAIICDRGDHTFYRVFGEEHILARGGDLRLLRRHRFIRLRN